MEKNYALSHIRMAVGGNQNESLPYISTPKAYKYTVSSISNTSNLISAAECTK